MSKENKSAKNSMGIGIAYGAGVGIIFGEIVFNDVGIGLVIGAGVGIVFEKSYQAISNKKRRMTNRIHIRAV